MAKEKTVRINVGIPGSGKSTESLDFISKNPGWVKIGRDDFRYMLRNAGILDSKGENLVTKLFFDSVRASILNGYNVILDNTFCKRTYINDVIEKLSDLANIEFKVFDVPLEECIRRDSLRERKVGASVVIKMHKDFATLKENYDFPFIPKAVRTRKNYAESWNVNLPEVVITDVDGTICHMNGKRGPFDWSKVGVDDPDFPMIKVLQAWKASGKEVIVVSGRDGSCRKETEDWLKLHEVPYSALFMRPAGDMRKDSLIKAEIYEKDLKGKYNIVMIYDDRDQVVETWRNLGLKCAQVEYGEF